MFCSSHQKTDVDSASTSLTYLLFITSYWLRTSLFPIKEYLTLIYHVQDNNQLLNLHTRLYNLKLLKICDV